ncbi:hypothetical protein OJ252_813 [Cryptosporidium canis]|uniref:Uncharacterized protein n=1 Tax=Cryptosporidium canis TaxID=195482 RepID=A0ABQ8P9S2_9CRYT|nr:hypothetical protein OJ252_813 [Cryptosporidium canis]
MSSDVLKVRCRQELRSLSLEGGSHPSLDRRSLAIWLFEWYESKGRRLPYGIDGKRVDEISEEELEFLHKILAELPTDFPMIRYSALWSKWLFPNINWRKSDNYYNIWLAIMKIMEERFPDVYVNDVDPLVKLVSDCLNSSSNPSQELCYVGLKLLAKLVSLYIPPRKGFSIVTGPFLESLRDLYTRAGTEDAFSFKIKQEITKLVQVAVCEKHLPSFLATLRTQVFLITGSHKQPASSNYTFDFYQTLVSKGSKFDCFLPLLIRKIHEVERSGKKEGQIRSTIGGDYLLFFLYLSLSLEDQKSFCESIQYVDECFAFFIGVNTFNIRESEDEFGNNFKLRIYELILKKLQECIRQRVLNPNVWNIIESSIVIDPIRCLELLPLLFRTDKSDTPKCEKPSLYGPLNIILDFISNEDLNPEDSSRLIQSESRSSSLNICISKYILTFIKLHDLPLLFSKFSEILNMHASSRSIRQLEQAFLSTEVLQTIKDKIGLSALPGQTSDIIDSFLGFLKINQSVSAIHESVSASWIGILMIAIPITESSIPNLEEFAGQIHQYILDSDSKKPPPESSKFIQTTCTVGIIHLLRKISAWSIERNDKLSEMLAYHYNKVLSPDFPEIHLGKHSSSSPFCLYSVLIHLIILLTQLRDSGSLGVDEFTKIFALYGQFLDDSQGLCSEDSAWKVKVNKVLTRFILTNISHLEGIETCIKSYVEDKDRSPHFDSFVASIFELFIQQNDVPSSIFKSVIQIPLLPGLLVDIALEKMESVKSLTGRKKRKVSRDPEAGTRVSYNFQVLDFWSRRDVVAFFVNNRMESSLEDAFPKISRLYLNLVFEFDSILGSRQDQDPLIDLLEKVTEGVMKWITMEEEIGANDFVESISRFLFDRGNPEEPNRLAWFLGLISRIEARTELSQNLNSILIRSARSASRSLQDPKQIGDLVIEQMDSLEWWWWMDPGTNLEDLLSKRRSWICQMQLCIDLSSETSFERMKERILGKVNILETLGGLKDQLKEDRRTELLYSVRICELYLRVNPEMHSWDLGGGNQDGETEGEQSLLRLRSVFRTLGGILSETQAVLEDTKRSSGLIEESFILLDLIIKYLSQGVLIINQSISSLRQDPESMKHCFELSKEVYSDTFRLLLGVIRVNLEFGIYRMLQDPSGGPETGGDHKTASEWSRYFLKCVLEGSSMKKEDYRCGTSTFRQMEIYEIISNLVSHSVTSLLNHAINEGIIKASFTREENLFVVLSYLDLFWGIVRNKGHIYKCLSPCLKGNPFSRISSWGASDRLEFTLEIMVSKFVDFLERRESDIRKEYILCTFSFVRLSNIISILYSCCVGCYISEAKDNARVGLNNSHIITISNMALVVSSKLSSIGLSLRFEDLANIVQKRSMDDNTRESFYLALFECLMISPYIPLYTLFNPLWDQSNRKKNKNQRMTGHLDVWISQFHLIEESLKNLLSLGECISLHETGLKLYTTHNKRISRLYPLIVSQVTKSKVQRYSISLVGDLINYIYVLNKRLEQAEESEELREIINLNIQIIKNSCLNPILAVIDNHCKQSLFTMLKDEQRIIFKQIDKRNSELQTFNKLEG